MMFLMCLVDFQCVIETGRDLFAKCLCSILSHKMLIFIVWKY